MMHPRRGEASLLVVMNAVLAMCVVGLTGVVVHSRLRGTAPATERPWVTPRVVPGLGASASNLGHQLGRGSASRRIIEFADYQCPFCRDAASQLSQLQRERPGVAAITFRNMPLDELHPRARPAARAAECAYDQGKFEPFHDALFLDQSGVGSRPWTSFAVSAGIADTTKFKACLASPRVDARVIADEHAADRLGIRGTPTFVVGDSIFEGLPPLSQLRSWFGASQ